MSALAELRANLTALSNAVDVIRAPVNRAHLAAKIAKSALAKPRQLSQAMQKLIRKADTLGSSSLFLTPFPVIGTMASRIGKILRNVKSTAEKVKRSADRMDEASKPAQKTVQAIEPPLNRAKIPLDRAHALLQGWLAIVTELEQRFGEQPPEKIEAACAKMNASLAPEIKAIDKAAPALQKDLNAVADALEDIAGASSVLDPALKTARDIEDRLEPLEGPLRELAKALRPVKWALDAARWVSEKVIDPIVNEILKAVGLQRLIDQLERTLNPFSDHLQPLQKAVAPLKKAVKALGTPARIARPLAKVPELEKKTVAGMQPLKTLVG